MKAVLFGLCLIGIVAFVLSADAETDSKIQNAADKTKEGAQSVGDKIKSAVGWGQEKTADARDGAAEKMREGADKVETRR